MTILAVIAYPSFTHEDHDWVEQFRTHHDPQTEFIAGHFTLVFPAEMPAAAALEHVASVASRTPPIAVVLRTALAVPDAPAGGAHVFLTPDEGGDEILALHRALYTGPFAALLREDIPYRPHLTIAANPDRAACETLAREANAAARVLPCVLDALHLVEITPTGMRSLAKVALGGAES